MTGSLPTDLLFWLVIPGLFLVLVFVWLLLISLGRKDVRLSLKGLGVSVNLIYDSKEVDSTKKGEL